MHYNNTYTYGDTSATSALVFNIDPDGIGNASLTAEGKSMQFALYYNGRLTSRGNVVSGSYHGPGVALSVFPDAPWFSWSN